MKRMEHSQMMKTKNVERIKTNKLSNVQNILNKDVLKIIGYYTKPCLWLYWINIPHRFDDQFHYSQVVEASNEDDVFIDIFKTNINYLVPRYIKLSDEQFHILKSSEVFKSDCVTCQISTNYKLCVNHVPSEEQLISLFFQNGKLQNKYEEQVFQEIDKIMRWGKLKIKKLTW